MKEKMLVLIEEGFSADKRVDKLYNYECIAYELNENFPSLCHSDADCYECWKLRIEKYWYKNIK